METNKKIIHTIFPEGELEIIERAKLIVKQSRAQFIAKSALDRAYKIIEENGNK